MSRSLDCHNAMITTQTQNGMHSAIHKDNLHVNTFVLRLPCDPRLVFLDRPLSTSSTTKRDTIGVHLQDKTVVV